MSENIQSISQGTYTIGQTSATNFVAGPGIKIDEPSAGTVRIGNDETVLWSGARAITSTGQLNTSENPYNFEKIEIWNESYPGFHETCFSFDTSGNGTIPFVSPSINDSLAAVRFNISRMILNASGIEIQNQKQYSITGTASTTADSPTIIKKVIGINRKEV